MQQLPLSHNFVPAKIYDYVGKFYHDNNLILCSPVYLCVCKFMQFFNCSRSCCCCSGCVWGVNACVHHKNANSFASPKIEEEGKYLLSVTFPILSDGELLFLRATFESTFSATAFVPHSIRKAHKNNLQDDNFRDDAFEFSVSIPFVFDFAWEFIIAVIIFICLCFDNSKWHKERSFLFCYQMSESNVLSLLREERIWVRI